MKKKKRIFYSEKGPKKVGRFYKSCGEFVYANVKFDEDDWSDALYFLPKDFDLCHCKIQNESRTFSGWHFNNSWDGLNIEPYHNVVYWKLNYDHKDKGI